MGIAHYNYDLDVDDSDYWKIMPSTVSIDEENHELTLDDVAISLLSKARNQSLRPAVTSWIACGENKNWTLGHNNPVKNTPRDIAPPPPPALQATLEERKMTDRK